MIKNLPELFRRPERRCFSIFEADLDPGRYHVKIDEGEKSYAHPPLHLTDDEM